MLYSLVFGEGVINDATAIVLLGATQQLADDAAPGWDSVGILLSSFIYLFLTSLLLGVSVGLLSALTVRRLTSTGACVRA